MKLTPYLIILMVASCQSRNKTIAISNVEIVDTTKVTSSIFKSLEKLEYHLSEEELLLAFKSQNLKEDLNKINIESSIIKPNVYYKLSNEQFLKKPLKDIDFKIYYKREFGDETEKILLIKSGQKTKRLVLASNGGDGQNSYRSNLEFLNDSIFKKVIINTETVFDGQEEVKEKVDSVTEYYSYDLNFSNVKLVNKYSMTYYLLTKTQNNKVIEKLIQYISDPFTINGQAVYWERNFKYRNDNGKMSDAPISNTDKLIRISDKKNILLTQEEYIHNFILSVEYPDFHDINLDGYLDFKHYSEENSGSCGSFFITYIYNNYLKIFEESKEFSGGDVAVDSLKRTVSTYWKSGVGWNQEDEKYLDKSGKIKHIIRTTREIIVKKNKQYLVTTIQKIQGTISTQIKKDTITFEGY